MGTLCKISGRGENSIRGQRTRRKLLVQRLYDEARDTGRPPANRIAVHAIACELDRIRKYSSRTGAEKEHRFRVIVNRTQFQSPV
jgi:hypothetical protein